MTRQAADSITAADIPRGRFPIVAGYCDGVYKWSDADWTMHLAAGSKLLRIAVSAATDDGEVLDVETGDATPEQARGWVRMRRAAGVEPAIYCNVNNFIAIQAIYQQLNEPRPSFWIATLDGKHYAIGGLVIACQWGGSNLTGGHWDQSDFVDYWPTLDKQEDKDMQGFIVVPVAGPQFAVLPTGYRFAIASQSDLDTLHKAGFVDAGSVTDGQLAQWPILGSHPSDTTTVPAHSHSVSGTAQ